MDAVKSHDALPTWRNSRNIAHVPQEFSQVCCYFLQKSGSEITFSVVMGDKARLGGSDVSASSGANLMLITQFAKL